MKFIFSVKKFERNYQEEMAKLQVMYANEVSGAAVPVADLLKALNQIFDYLKARYVKDSNKMQWWAILLDIGKIVANFIIASQLAKKALSAYMDSPPQSINTGKF